VVIAIIAIVISILLPVLIKARTKAQILASPLVYQTWQDNGFHVTDGKLDFDNRIFREPGPSGCLRYADVRWSPSGLKIGFALSKPFSSEPKYMCILNPLTGELTKHLQMENPSHPSTYFYGWIDESKLIEWAEPKLYIRDATTGAVLKTFQHRQANNTPFYNLPADAPAPFICRGGRDGMYGIFLAGKDLRLSKPVWLDPTFGSGELSPTGQIGVDPTGQWVAFQVGQNARTAIKHMHDPAALVPKVFAVNETPLRLAAQFACWIGPNELLHTQGQELVVVDRNGKMLRKRWVAEWTIPPAAWRKFMQY